MRTFDHNSHGHILHEIFLGAVSIQPLGFQPIEDFVVLVTVILRTVSAAQASVTRAFKVGVCERIWGELSGRCQARAARE